MKHEILLGVALVLAVSGPAAADTVNGKPPRLALEIAAPAQGAVIGDPGGMAFVSGRALALYGEYQAFDIVFVIDTSDSTAAPSGADVDGDGNVGHRKGEDFLSIFGRILPLPNSDRGDSVLAAEIAAVETLLEQLDPRTTRVGVVYFSGDLDPITPDAATMVPLTTNYDQVRKGLYEILRYGPHGRTNMLAGVNVGTIELLGTQSAYSEKRPNARKVMIFLTDGTPTLPMESSPNQNMRMAIRAARKAARHDIRIDTYAIGERALQEPVVAVEMAHATQGVFTPVRQPRDLQSVFEHVDFARIDDLRVHNKTTSDPASYVLRNPDGSFSALLPMQDGGNTIEVYARATDGTEARRFIKVKFLPEAGMQQLDARLAAQRNRLLESRLLDLKRRSVQISTERDEGVRRDLMDEIQEERAKAEAKALEHRKQLEIGVEE
ncbi:MAG: VWA domain-containing protein [Deltaproteobacteria bacterium]|nr:VWA domain-containing protein [Deltaproteobacteria bacterium]